MSTEGVAAFLEKALNDESFQAQLRKDPDNALGEFDLTDNEIEAIKSGGEEELQSLGVDERLSKLSFFGGGIPGLEPPVPPALPSLIPPIPLV